MNCRNCGAAMTLVDGRDHFRCDFCRSFHFPDEGGDGARVVGAPSGLACPACGGPLHEARVEGEPAHACPRCRGFLTGNASFAAVVRQRRGRRPVGESRHAFDPGELRRAAHCPRCRRRMDTHPYYGGGRVVVDTCPPCGLIWLDAGELAVIERHNLPKLVSEPPPASDDADPAHPWKGGTV